MAIAPLGFSVDTSQVAKAQTDLNGLVAATTKADTAVKGLGTDAKQAAAGIGQVGAASDTAAAQVQRMAANTNAAQQQMRNLSFQFQDIGTMLAAGQSPFLLLAQQLPQVTMYGGRLTGVMGALKQTFAGLLSPLGLLTVGFVVATSAAISFFSDSADEAEKLKEELEEQGDMIQRVADEWGNAVPEISAYADEIERLLDLADLRGATTLTIEKQFDNAEQALDRFIRAAQDMDISTFNAVADDIIELERAAEELETAQKAGEATTEQFAAVQRLLASIINNDALPATGDLRNRVNELGEAYTEAARRAGEAAEQFSLLDSRGGVGISEFQGGRGSDPRDSFEDEGGYWGDRMFPDPEKAPRKRRTSSRKTDAQKAVENYAEMIRSSQQFITQQQLEAQALGMTEEAANALRYEQDLLNQAANDNIKLTPQMVAELESYAQAMASAEAETAKLGEQIDFADDLTRGFLNDVVSSLRQGEGVWESFSKAAINALDRITQKLIDMVADDLIAQLFGGLLGGGGGLFGGGGDPWAGLRLAKGGVMDGGNVVPFARGGIVNSPTIFPFAKGVGLMGEAGPESIMPLRRDSQGNLGVIASGGGGGGFVNQVIINNAPPGTTAREEGGTNSDGSQWKQTIIDIVKEGETEGAFDSARNGRYGNQLVKTVR